MILYCTVLLTKIAMNREKETNILLSLDLNKLGRIVKVIEDAEREDLF